MSFSEIIDFVTDWRGVNNIAGDAPLSELQLIDFSNDLQAKIASLPITPQRLDGAIYDSGTPSTWHPNSSLIAYSGSVGDTQTFRIAAALSQAGEGTVFYISDTLAGKIIGERRFKDAVARAAGGSNFEMGVVAASRLISGYDADNNRIGKYAFPGVLTLDDFVSERMVMAKATGNVWAIVPNAQVDRVFYETELPAILSKSDVTAVNGVPKEILLKLYQAASIPKIHVILSVSSFELMKDMRIGEVDGKLVVDPGTFFRGTQVSVPSTLAGATNIRDVGQILANEMSDLDVRRAEAARTILEADLSITAETGVSKLGTGLKYLGALGTAVSLLLIAGQASAAENSGDREGAAKIVAIGMSQLATEIGVDVALAPFTGAALAALLPAGPVGWALGALLVIGNIAIGAASSSLVKDLMESVTGYEQPLVSESSGWRLTEFRSGFIFSEAIAPNQSGIDREWIVPDGSHSLQIQQDADTGIDIRRVWSGAAGTGTLLSQTVTTPKNDGTVTVATSTLAPTGDTVTVTEHRDMTGGDLLDTATRTDFQDGRVKLVLDDGEGNFMTIRFDAAENKVGEQWEKRDGSHGEIVYNPDTGGQDSSTTNPDGSSIRTSDDGFGNTSIREYNPMGSMVREQWEKFDGTSGAKIVGQDGSVTTENVAVDGSLERVIDDGKGNVQTGRFDPVGKLTERVWSKADGSSGFDLYDNDGNRRSFVDDGKGTTYSIAYDAAGTKLSSEWTRDDATGSEVYHPDGSSEAIIRYRDGSKEVVETDTDGTFISTKYSLGGEITARNWRDGDGAEGREVYSSNGTKIGEVSYLDGSKRRYTDDGDGNVVLTTVNAAGKMVSADWSKGDGTRGRETVDAAGVRHGTIFTRNGAHHNYTISPDGKEVVRLYDGNGNFVSESVKYADGSIGKIETGADGMLVNKLVHPDGSYQETSYRPDGVVRHANFNGDGSGRSTLDDGAGLRIETSYGVGGIGILTNKITSYNPNGSGTVTFTDANGNTTVTNYGPGQLGPWRKPRYDGDHQEKPGRIALPGPGDASEGSGSADDNADVGEPTYDDHPDVAGGDGMPEFSEEEWAAIKEVLYAREDIASGRDSMFDKDRIDYVVEQYDIAEEIFSTVISPLTLDLDGDGLETLAMSEGVRFDHDGNAFVEKSGWVAPDDGLLVYDRDGDGVISTGAELFGNFTPLDAGGKADNGFEALQDFDSNQDGQVNATDSKFAGLRIWRDADSDGLVDAGELLALPEAGVASIATAYDVSGKVDSRNNQHRQLGQFTRSDGTWGQIHDIWFERDAALPTDRSRTPYEPVAHTPEIDALPDIAGVGGLRNLRDAMALRPDLQAAVAAYVAEPSSAKRSLLADTIIQRWTGADLVQFEIDSLYYNERHLFALDTVSGAMVYDRNYNERPNAGPLAAEHIENAYGTLLTEVTRILERQLAGLQLNRLLIDVRDLRNSVEISYAQERAKDPKVALRNLALLYQSMGSELAHAGFDIGAMLAREALLSAGNPEMRAYLDTLQIFIGDGTVGQVTGTSSIMLGGNGNDTLTGGVADDILDGGKGDDLIYVNQKDIVMVGPDSGHDTLAPLPNGGEVHATIMLDSSIAPSDVRVSGGAGELLLEMAAGGSIRLPGWGERGNVFTVGLVKFADGTVWKPVDLWNLLPSLTDADETRTGTPDDNVLAGGGGNDVLYGGAGDDLIDGGAGADKMYGDAGHDILLGGAGNDVVQVNGSGGDVVVGGRGNDTIHGGLDADTYFFAHGDGEDIIHGSAPRYSRVIDTVIFGPGIRPQDLVVLADFNLTLAFRGSNDVLHLPRGGSAARGIDRFVFDDGTILTQDQLIVLAPTEADDTLWGTDEDGTLHMLGGDDTVRAMGGDDWVDGGAGADSMSGGDGQDRLLGGAGDDALSGEGGHDTLVGGAGNDSLDGGLGNNVYVFGRGDGHDTIFQAGKYADQFDTIVLGVNPSDIVAEVGVDDADLVLRIRDSNDSLTLDQWRTHGRYPATMRVEFADGTVWTSSDIPVVSASSPTDERDVLYASDAGGLLRGLGGDDRLIGGSGDDTLDGGDGDDWLDGGAGSDVYLFGYGSGRDIIREDGSADVAGTTPDTVRMGAGIRPEDVELSWSTHTDGYILRLKDSDDELEIINRAQVFRGRTLTEEQRIEYVEFEDGTVWDLSADPAGSLAAQNFTTFVKGSTVVPLVPNDGSGTAPGANSYHFNFNSGQVILNAGAGAQPVYDELYISPASPEDVTLRWSNGTLYFQLLDNDGVATDDLVEIPGRIRIVNGEVQAIENSLKRVVFATGQIWNLSSDPVNPIANATYSLDIQGATYDDLIVGRDTSGFLSGGFGNDTLLGGAGNDRLDGGEGADVLDGGAGDDWLAYGGEDRILFGHGSGADRAYNSSGVRATLVLKEGIGPEDIELEVAAAGNLIVHLRGTGDKITLEGWFERFRQRFEDDTVGFEFSDGTQWDAAAIRHRIAQNEHSGDEYFYDTVGDDLIDAGAGDDIIQAGMGNDTLVGGAGDDMLTGGEGLTVYRFERGFGHDTIQEDRLVRHGANRVVFGDGIRPQDIIVTGDNSSTPNSTGNLYLSVFGSTDKLTIHGWFSQYNRPVSTVEFADGTVWGASELIARFHQLERGGDMAGSELADKLNGDSTDDQIHGADGDDAIDGGAGNDSLFGEGGNDVLRGGAGNDRLYGGIGDDHYVFERGFGHDVLADFDRVNGTHDVIEFGAGIGAEQISVSRTASDIVLKLDGGTDSLSIRWYGHAGLRIEQLRFADGTMWTGEQLQARADGTVTISGSDGGDLLVGGDGVDRLVGLAGNDELAGLGGVDLLEGGEGDDRLDGGGDSDRLLGGAGDDLLDGGASADELIGGSGDDTYVVEHEDDGVYEAAGDGNDLVRSGIDHALQNNVERLELIGTASMGAGNSLDNTLSGNAGNNLLYGEGGADTLIGRAGDDQLLGGAGNDVYLYGRGDGSDLVIDADPLAGNVDTIRFDATISSTDVLVTMSADYGAKESDNDLRLMISPSGDVITLKDWLAGPAHRIERVEFADGTSWDVAELVRQAFGQDNMIPGGWAADVLQGGAADERIDGRDGNDNLLGGAGDDTLIGGAGDDRLYGGAGADSLTGGEGNDVLDGGAGADTYLYERGARHDRIVSWGEGGDTDTLQFGANISWQDVSFVYTEDSDDLALDIASHDETDLGGRVTLMNWFADGASRPLAVRFADDDKVWSIAELLALSDPGPTPVPQGTVGDDLLSGNDTPDDISGDAGNDEIHGNGGDDVINGGAGDDLLYGGAGDDIYLFGAGDGADRIVDEAYASGGIDRLRFATDITQDMVVFARQEDALVLSYGASSVTLSNWFATTGDRVQAFEFGDGTMRAAAAIEQELGGTQELIGSADGDYLSGSSGNDVIRGLAGADFLEGLEGNDMLAGGQDDDFLSGSAGDDVYLVERGDGVDTISDQSDLAGEVDTLQFGASIAPADVVLRKSGDDLLVAVRGTQQQIRIANWFDPSRRIEQMVFADDTIWSVQDMFARLPGPSEGADDLVNFAGPTLSGLGGDDILTGLEGDDILDGGSGNDELFGRAGNDVYLFGRGAGRDTIYEDIDVQSNVDTLRIDSSVDPASLRVNRTADGLLLTIVGSSDQVELLNWYAEPDASVEAVEFSDGTVWDRAALQARITNVGSADDDSLVGDDGDDLLEAHGGRDFLYGEEGDDTLDGGAGDDELSGGGGNDTIEGGSGSDWLNGGEGKDTYRFSAGFGFDALWDQSSPTDDADLIRLQGIDPAQVVVSHNGDALFLSLDGASDSLQLLSWFESELHRNKKIVFDDGTTWDADELESRIDPLHTSAGIDIDYGSEDPDTILALAGADMLFGNGGNDVLDGGEGDDVVLGGAGIDLLRGGAGNDEIADENDGAVIDAGAGDDAVRVAGTAGLVAGGTGNDDITLGGGQFVVGFNRGDGNDALRLNQAETILSLNALGDEIALRRDAGSSDLVIEVGQSDSMRLVDWYAGSDQPLILQLMGSQAVMRYDLSALVAQFDTANPVGRWAVGDLLAQHELADAANQASGGELARGYALDGSLVQATTANIDALFAPDMPPEAVLSPWSIAAVWPMLRGVSPAVQLDHGLSAEASTAAAMLLGSAHLAASSLELGSQAASPAGRIAPNPSMLIM